MTTPVIGNGPFEFTDPHGTQISIPLSALDINASGGLEVNAALLATYDQSTQALISILLNYVKQQGLIVAAPAPSPKPAMVITAIAPGSSGNNIQVTIATPTPVTDPGSVVFSLTVAEIEKFPGLDLGSVKNTLATKSKLANVDTLVDKTLFPADIQPNQAFVNQPARVDIKDKADSSKTVFGLAANKPGSDGNLTSVAILGKPANTFDLTITWTKVFSGLTLAALPGDFSSADIKVSPPTVGGKIFSVPAGGNPIALTGGSDSPSAAASAIVFSA